MGFAGIIYHGVQPAILKIAVTEEKKQLWVLPGSSSDIIFFVSDGAYNTNGSFGCFPFGTAYYHADDTKKTLNQLYLESS